MKLKPKKTEQGDIERVSMTLPLADALTTGDKSKLNRAQKSALKAFKDRCKGMSFIVDCPYIYRQCDLTGEWVHCVIVEVWPAVELLEVN